MLRKCLFVFMLGCTVATATGFVRAHHSEAAEFDRAQQVKVTGTLSFTRLTALMMALVYELETWWVT